VGGEETQRMFNSQIVNQPVNELKALGSFITEAGERPKSVVNTQ